ncbi:hypothetical protein LIER_15851 [Lithospermum erythrorhizon]|uniref:Uncharacterized protein n=1 Tax=Lithospermum erythrorhizon TaxID=34254 RepID=A0AAV3Q4G7_LITER
MCVDTSLIGTTRNVCLASGYLKSGSENWFDLVKYNRLNVGSDVVWDLSWVDGSEVVLRGDRSLQDTPTSSPIRKNSPVRVIDTTTIQQVLKEINEYLANPDALITTTDENQTLPDSSSTPTDVPSSTTEGSASQPMGDEGEDSGALLAFIQKSLPVPFMDTQLWDSKEYFSILADVGIRVPVKGESIIEPIVKEGDKDGAFCPG